MMPQTTPRWWRQTQPVPAVIALLLLLTLAPSASATETNPQTPPDRVVERLRSLEPFSVGTDRNGNLWAWSRDEGTVILFDDEGRERTSWKLPQSSAVDVDAEWGVVALDPVGMHLIRPGAEGASPLRLYGQAHSVAWLGEDRVAVGSALGPHRVVVWNLDAGEVVQRIDEEGPVPAGIGARLSRTLEMEVNPLNGNLYVLDSFSGQLTIYDPKGRRLNTLEIRDPERQGFDDWLKEIDAEARKTGDLQRPGVWRFHLGVGSDGSAWIVEHCPAADRAQVLRVPVQGDAERMELETSCCSRRFAVWQDQLVFQDRANLTRQACYGWRRIPK